MLDELNTSLNVKDLVSRLDQVEGREKDALLTQLEQAIYSLTCYTLAKQVLTEQQMREKAYKAQQHLSKKVQSEMRAIGPLVAGILSGVVQIGSVGAFPFGGAEFARAVGIAGQGVGALGQTAQSLNQATVTGSQHRHEVATRRRDAEAEEAGRLKQFLDKASQSLKDIRQQLFQAFTDASRG